MLNNNDKTTFCTHCFSQLPLCYEVKIDETNKSYFCLQCGFSSNTLMKPGSEYAIRAASTMPQLYVDALFEDETGKMWFPTTVNMPEKGMVFLSGTSLDDCEWAAIKSTPVTEEEKPKFKIKGKEGEYYKHKMDNTTLKMFGKNGFMDGLEYIGVISDGMDKTESLVS
jgi:hypothetical protein